MLSVEEALWKLTNATGFEELKTVNLHSIHVNKLHTIARSLSVAPFAG